jgi:hypothetical protein
VVYSLVTSAFDFFWEEGSEGEPFLFFMISTLSSGLCLTSSKSPPSPPWSGVMEFILTDRISIS